MLDDAARTLALAAPLAHLREHGYARLGRVVSDAGLAALRQRADEIMLAPTMPEGLFFQQDSTTGQYEDLAFGQGWVGPSLTYRKIEKLEKDDRYLAWLANPLYERIARALIPGDIAIYRAVLMTKAASGGTELHWHQDGGRFWGVDRDPTLQIWTALDDAPIEAGCVEVVPGSHHAGLATPGGGNLPPALRQGADARAVALPALAGEALLIHNHTWHRSGRNVTGRTRRAFTVCYMSADTQCLRKKRAPREFFRPFSGPTR